MASSWHIDVKHFLDESGAVSVKVRRRAIVRHVGAVISAMTKHDGIAALERIAPCHRRPGHLACTGHITARFESDERISWICPVCRDQGAIAGWQRTLWDRGGRPDLPTIQRIRYRRGLISGGDKCDRFEEHMLAGAAVSRELVVAIHDNGLLAAHGDYGDPGAGTPIQFDELVFEHGCGTCTIRVFNRAIMLFTTNEEIFVRVHRVCSIIERTPREPPAG